MATQRILIVEDDPAIAAFVQTALEREGFATEIAGNGRQALDRADPNPPDLILLDLMLPRMDGLQVCQAIRRRPVYIPIILLALLPLAVDAAVGRVVRSRTAETLEISAPGRPIRRMQVSVAPPVSDNAAPDALALFTDPGAMSGRAEVYQRLISMIAHETHV